MNWLLIFWLVLPCQAQFAIQLVAKATNAPAQNFDAAHLGHAVYHSSNLCHTGTFVVTGDPGIYRWEWQGTNHPGEFLTCWQTIQHTNGPVTITNLPVVPQSWGFYRLTKL